MENAFGSKEEFMKMIQAWREFYNDKDSRCKLQAYHFGLYAALRGKDWRNHYAPTTRKDTKDELEYRLFKQDTKYLDLTPFGEITTPEHIGFIREHNIEKWGA